MADEIKINFTKRGSFSKLDETMVLPTNRPIVFGRSTKDTDVYLEEQDVSGRHLEIRREADGFFAVCLSRYGMKVNERKVGQGESVRLSVEDEIMLGAQVRFRIKSLPESDELSDDEDSVTDGETVALDDAESGTGATRPVPDETLATRPAPEETQGTRPLSSDMTMETTPFKAEEIVARTPVEDALSGEITPSEELAHAKRENTDAPSAAEPITADAPSQTDSPTTTGSDADSVSGGTIAGGTIGVKKDVFERMRQNEIAAQKARRLLKFFLISVILLVSAATIWVFRPKDEILVNFPMVDGKPDVKSYKVQDENGQHILDVYYPVSKLMKEISGKGTFSVDTYNGRKRNVPYKLAFQVKRNELELEKSLVESFCDWRSACEKSEKIVFVDSPAGSWGEFFFEDKYPAPDFCQQNSLHGLATIMAEYTIDRAGSAWHGTVTYFRSGDSAYILRREIPEKHWARGKWLMEVNPNIAVYNSFNLPRWESPGKDKMRMGLSVKELEADARQMLQSDRVFNWIELERTIDTLMAVTWRGKDDERKVARSLLTEYRVRKENYYKRLLNAFDSHRRNEDFRKMQEVFNNCKSVFGADAKDRRFNIFNNPEIWSCRKER